jgi:hypothetical protein
MLSPMSMPAGSGACPPTFRWKLRESTWFWPGSSRLAMTGRSVYGPGHLTQHHAHLLRARLMMHGFKHVRIRGSGRVSRYAGERFPLRAIYGSYLVSAEKR